MKLRKLMGVILAAGMCLTVGAGTAFAAPALDKFWPEETVKIGVVDMDTTTSAYDYIVKYCKYIEDHYNVQFIMSEAIDTAEEEMAFIESCAAAGCAGIIGWRNVGGAAIIKLCGNKEIYYWMSNADDVVLSRYGDNEYFLGYLEAGAEVDYAKGYSWGRALIDAGCHRVVYMSGGADYGVSIFVERRNGFYAAIEEAQAEGVDIEVIYEINTWPDSDAYSAMQDTAIAMNPDGIADSVGIDYWVQPLNTAGKLDGSLKMATNINLTDDTVDLYDLDVIAGGIYADYTMSYIAPAIPLILNAVTGHKELAKLEDGNTIPAPVPYWEVNSSEDIHALVDYTNAGGFFLTAEDMSEFFPEFNPDTSIEEYQNVFGGLTLEYALELANQ